MGRPPRDQPLLSLELIVETALRFLNTHGLKALSMRQLARELNVAPGSLYHWVASKDALLDIVMAHTLEQSMTLPAEASVEGDWDMIIQIGRNFRAVCKANPCLAPLLQMRVSSPRMELILRERLCVLMQRGGIPEQHILPLATSLPHLLVGYVIAEGRGEFTPGWFEKEQAVMATDPKAFPYLGGRTAPTEEVVFETTLAFFLKGIIGFVD